MTRPSGRTCPALTDEDGAPGPKSSAGRARDSVDWLDLAASHHPTAAGQAGYERVFSASAG